MRDHLINVRATGGYCMCVRFCACTRVIGFGCVCGNACVGMCLNEGECVFKETRETYRYPLKESFCLFVVKVLQTILH